MPPHSAFRGTAKPAWLSVSAATAIAAAAAVASGIVAGPAHAQAVTGHLTTLADVTRDHAGRGAHGASLLGDYASATSGTQAAAAPLAMAAAAPAMAAAPAIATGQATSSAASSASGQAAGAAATPAPTASSGSSQASAAPSTNPSAAPSASPSPSAPPEQPLQFYDSVIPAAIPSGNVIATYATGGYAVPASAVAGRPTIWIDTLGTDPAASVLDIEPGDATPAVAAIWVAEKLAKDPTARARLYTMRSEWPAVQAAVSTLPSWMQAQVRYWIADPTGVPHMVAGANATQWYWGQNYDISTANPGF